MECKYKLIYSGFSVVMCWMQMSRVVWLVRTKGWETGILGGEIVSTLDC